MDERSLDNLLNLVYADHVRRIANDICCNSDHAINHVDDIEVIRDFISELVNCECPRGVRNAYIGQLCRVEWRINHLKTNVWRELICRMVTSMNGVENRFTEYI